ncbi:hypothetical protein Q5P01_010548 [Channa striata]|uniref:Uncharacterized protein n=1 Tax=Channa striata TaxID=64152 RepID=A0AA88MY72_CHASR|nr:hypothetical protein Q5P01_010548 [Channa striata]
MLANPNLAPFEVLDKPLEHKDWILIDHLMVIHKVKESDYVESEPATSVLNMARTLACNYMPEGPHARSVVLVKDGPGTQKPSVREIRTARVTAPHIEFCKRHPGEIEYAVKKLLADVGPGDSQGYSYPPSPSRRARGWRRYARRVEGAGAPKLTRCWWSWTRLGRSCDNVQGRLGPSRFSHGQREGRSDSDTGQKGDAWLTTGAKPRERARLRASTWRYELSRGSLPSPVRRAARRQTAAAFERILEDHGVASFRSEVVDYLYLGGIRGSVHVAFLGRFF